MNKYFSNVNSLEELRSQYKELLKKFHPDNPSGSTEATQEINAEYDILFKMLKDRHRSKATDNNDSYNADNNKAYNNMKYDFSEDEKLREVLNHIIILSGINIEIVGCWIWVDGETYLHKDTLKSLGFKWASEKKKWYFHSETFRKKSKRNLSMNDIRNLYGSTEIHTNERIKLNQV